MKGCFLIQELVSFASNELLLVQVDFLCVYVLLWHCYFYTLSIF